MKIKIEYFVLKGMTEDARNSKEENGHTPKHIYAAGGGGEGKYEWFRKISGQGRIVWL